MENILRQQFIFRLLLLRRSRPLLSYTFAIHADVCTVLGLECDDLEKNGFNAKDYANEHFDLKESQKSGNLIEEYELNDLGKGIEFFVYDDEQKISIFNDEQHIRDKTNVFRFDDVGKFYYTSKQSLSKEEREQLTKIIKS